MRATSDRVYLVLNEPGTMGGIQRVVASLAQELRSQGADVTVVGLRRPRPGEQGLDMGVPVIYPFARLRPRRVMDRLNRGGMRVERALRPWQGLGVARLGRLLRARPGHIVAMDVFAAEMVARVPRTPATTRVVQYHNSFDSVSGTRDMDRLVRASRHFDHFLALTEGDATSFSSRISVPTSSMPNPAPFAPAEPSQGRPARVLSIGRLSEVKNVELTIQAWSRLAPSIRDAWTLTIAGDGPRRPHIAQLIKDLGVSGSTEMIGPQPDSYELLRNSQVLVLSSSFEGLPMVLLEAMSQQVACLATDSSHGVRGLLTDGRGALVPLGDPAALAAALEDLLVDDARRLATAVRGQEHLQLFDKAVIARRWLSLLGIESDDHVA